ncbi:MAG: alpha/beta hydrolase-fold protein [Pirellulales bacterium]
MPWWLLLVSTIGQPAAAEAPRDTTRIAAARITEDGLRVHAVESPLQSAATEIRVLSSPDITAAAPAPVVYVLPVEAARESRYGDGLREIQERGLATRFRAHFVAPTFARLPWYADHPRQADGQQERYFVQVVVPFIERTYPVRAGRAGRLLLGFSKSGWGAWSLLLRHPEMFERAVAWDAPLMLDRPGPYGSGEIFGDDATFRRYELSARLRSEADRWRGTGAARLLHCGYDNFRNEHLRMEQLLTELQIHRQFRDGPRRKHDWHSGWVAEALEMLLNEAP